MNSPAFACEDAMSRRFRLDDVELHTLDWAGDGPGLLFLHGGSAHAHWFDRVIPSLRGQFHVVSLDQRGHGESTWPVPPAYRTEDFAADIAGVADALGWSRFSLVGHSMGGHNALSFAAWHPDRVCQLVIIDSRPAIPPDRLDKMHARGHRPLRKHPSVEAAIASFRLLPRDTVADPVLLAHLARAGVVERDGRWLYRFDPACNGRRQPVDTWALLHRIAAPTLIIRGQRSANLPREMADRMRATIPEAAVVEIPGAYHHVTLDAPDPCAAALGDFLNPNGGEQRP